MIAVISDIHGNLEALEAVLADAKREGASRIICLGDVVGYGADPVACLDRVLAVSDAFVLGNHDEAAVDPSLSENFNEVAQVAIRWTHETLGSTHFDALRDVEFESVGDAARFVHASPCDPPSWRYILTEQEAWDAFEACPEDLCFVGHSHVPLRVLLKGGRLEVVGDAVIEVGAEERALVNVGSVGQPRDGDWRASYALFAPDTRRVIARRVEYDRPAAARKILAAGLPEILAKRLAVGQ